MSNEQIKFNSIKELIKDLSKVFPNIKNDNDTVTIWGKQLIRFDIKSIELAKERIINSHSGYLYPNDFIKLVKSFKRDTLKFHKKEIIPAPQVRNRIKSLLNKLSD